MAGVTAPCLPDGLDHVDTAYVTARLEAAGATLMALPAHGAAPAGIRSAWPDIVRSVWDAYKAERQGLMRPPRPSGAAIDAMDEAFAWISLLGPQAIHSERLIWMRLMVWPLSGKHRFSWRKIAEITGLHRDVLVLRHRRGIERMVTRINCPSWRPPSGSDLP